MTDTHHLRASELSVTYGERLVIPSLSLEVPQGKITAIVGANGSGKSTLLRALSRLLKPALGAVLFDDKPIHQIPSKQFARSVGLLPQAPIAPEGIVVADLVGRGRYPHQGPFAAWSRDDYRIVAESLDAAGIPELADRPVDELSGGQKQRVWVAMALAQQTDILLLDEPTTYLDIAHQVEILDLITDLNQDRGTTVVMVLHDLNLAARYADELIAMRSGEILRMGPSAAIVNEGLVEAVFGVRSTVITDPSSGRPLIVPVGRHHVHPNQPRSENIQDA